MKEYRAQKQARILMGSVTQTATVCKYRRIFLEYWSEGESLSVRVVPR